MRKEFDIVFYALAMGFGFVWLFGFAVGYPNALVPFVLFALAVASFVLGWRSR